MTGTGISTARYATFTEFYPAVGHLLNPTTRSSSRLPAWPPARVSFYRIVRMMPKPRCAGCCRSINSARRADEVVIEERLEGQEVSVLAFTDGVTVRPMPPAQDHKRLRDGDAGPNTGGMGAYAPAPICPPALVEEITRTVLQPTVDGCARKAGRLSASSTPA